MYDDYDIYDVACGECKLLSSILICSFGCMYLSITLLCDPKWGSVTISTSSRDCDRVPYWALQQRRSQSLETSPQYPSYKRTTSITNCYYGCVHHLMQRPGYSYFSNFFTNCNLNLTTKYITIVCCGLPLEHFLVPVMAWDHGCYFFMALILVLERAPSRSIFVARALLMICKEEKVKEHSSVGFHAH